MYYHGVYPHGGCGHFFYNKQGQRRWNHTQLVPWNFIDGVLAADDPKEFRRMPFQEKYPNGQAKIHHLDGWTALAFWDTSGDSRDGSNSVFFAKGTHDFVAMIKLSQENFSDIWDRISFRVFLFLEELADISPDEWDGLDKRYI